MDKNNQGGMHLPNEHTQGTSSFTRTTTQVAALVSALVAAGLFAACNRDSPAKAMLKQYANQANCGDLARFTLDGEKDRPRLESFYKGKSCGLYGAADTAACDTVPVGGDCIAPSPRQDFCLRRTGESEYKVDWPCTVGWNETSLAVVKTGPLDRALVLRLRLKLADSYYGSFEDKTRWYSTEASDPNSSLHAYFRRNTALSNQLMVVLKDGAEHAVTVVVSHPRNAKGAEEVEILSLIRTDWRSLTAKETPDLAVLYHQYRFPGEPESKKMLACRDALKKVAGDDKRYFVPVYTATESAIRLVNDEDSVSLLKAELASISGVLAEKGLPVPAECASK